MPRRPITRAHPYTPKSGPLAGRTFHSERQYRNALAKRKGFRSWSQQQRSLRTVRTAHQFLALRSSAREARDRALEALSRMRRDGLSLTRAAKQSGTTPATVWRYAGAVLARSRRGRIAANPTDRLYRRMRVLTAEGVKEVAIRGSHVASRIGAHWNAVRKYVDTGDESGLRAFADTFPAGMRLATDPVFIDQEARRGELDFEDIYALSA
jgi:hypothetical protein